MSVPKIAIIGLGYVGLPLARLFATKYTVVGFDIKPKRVNEVKSGVDVTLEVADDLLKSVLVQESTIEKGLYVTCSEIDIENCDYYIVTVPTSVDKNNQPILTPLLSASKTIGSVLKKRSYCCL